MVTTTGPGRNQPKRALPRMTQTMWKVLLNIRARRPVESCLRGLQASPGGGSRGLEATLAGLVQRGLVDSDLKLTDRGVRLLDGRLGEARRQNS